MNKMRVLFDVTERSELRKQKKSNYRYPTFFCVLLKSQKEQLFNLIYCFRINKFDEE